MHLLGELLNQVGQFCRRQAGGVQIAQLIGQHRGGAATPASVLCPGDPVLGVGVLTGHQIGDVGDAFELVVALAAEDGAVAGS